MTDFPLLPMPTPDHDDRPAGPRGGARPIVPTRRRQGERLQPTFQRVQDVFDRGDDPLTLLADPSAIAPERALVFEVAGNVDALGRAVSNLPGLEYLGDEALEFEADEDFAEVDNRKGQEGQPRRDRPVRGRLYLTMPDTRALRDLLGLWNRHRRGLTPGRGNKPWFDLFDQLHRLRAWGPEDRLRDETVAYLNKRLEDIRDNVVRLEVELWWRGSARRAQSRFVEAVEAADGQIVHQASIPEIGYRAALVDVPVAEVRRLAAREEVALAVCDEIMLIRPQSTAAFPTDAKETDAGRAVEQPAMPEGPPIVAVFDGVPVLAHQLLDDRGRLDDPDDLAGQSEVSERFHGTEMASLVIHGDRNLRETPLTRPIYVRPVLYAPGDGRRERTQPDRLLVDTIYRAVLRMRVGEGDLPPQAPEVFIINLSLGDLNRPFTGSMSPWGRLLDHLAARFGLLFIVSAGNISANLPVSAFQGVTDFETASHIDRQHAILEALGSQRSQRTLLSPAEALNPITVGAWHEDAVESQPSSLVYRPYVDDGPNVTSAMGLGHNKVVKPDIFMPGGREHLQPVSLGGGLVMKAAPPGRFYGLKAAVPDGGGQLDREALTAGTSVATALATRSAHRLFDALMDEDNGGVLEDVDRRYYAVVVKALLVHRARWGDVGVQLEGIYGPTGQGSYVARHDNIARVLGYGRPNVEEALTCAANRATLVGYGEISSDRTAALFRVPLPRSLERVTEPRTITLTLAWFSPVNIRHRAYRRAKLEIMPNDFNTSAGVKRSIAQPSDKSVPRGSLFHVRYEGNRAVPFVDDGHLSFRVFCREQGGSLDEQIRYGIAVTIEAGEHVPVYQEVRQRLGVRVRGTN